MADSIVQICNNALIKLGADTIISLSDNTKSARLCNKMYSILRDDLLRSHPWNFAIKRLGLAKLSAAPSFGYTFQYQLPSDCLRVLKLSEHRTEYRIEGRKLLTDSNDINLIYIKKEEDTTQYDANFSNVLALRIASEIAYNITNSASMVNITADLYKKALAEAKTFDAQEDSINVLKTDTFLDARHGGSPSGITFDVSRD